MSRDLMHSDENQRVGSRFKHIMLTTLKVVIGLGLASYFVLGVIRDNDVDLQRELSLGTPLLLTAAVLFYGAMLALCIVRWRLLLHVQGIVIPFWKLTGMAMIGTFFSLVLPGAVTGDLVKMGYLITYANGRNTEAFLTVLLDRVMGLFGLFAVASIVVVTSIPYLRQADSIIQIGAMFVAGGGIGAIIVMLGTQFRHQLMVLPGVASMLAFLARTLPTAIVRIINRLVDAIELYRERPRTIMYALLTSMAVHTMSGTSIYFVGQGINESILTYNEYFLATQVANTAGSVPLFPGGVGIRDKMLTTFLIAAGANGEKAGAVAVFYSVIIAGWGLLGGLFFIFMRRSAHSASPMTSAEPRP